MLKERQKTETHYEKAICTTSVFEFERQNKAFES